LHAEVEVAIDGSDVKRRRDGELSRSDRLFGTHTSDDGGSLQVVVADGLDETTAALVVCRRHRVSRRKSVFRVGRVSDLVDFYRRVGPGHESSLAGSSTDLRGREDGIVPDRWSANYHDGRRQFNANITTAVFESFSNSRMRIVQLHVHPPR